MTQTFLMATSADSASSLIEDCWRVFLALKSMDNFLQEGGKATGLMGEAFEKSGF